jgi:glycosyltransferase involved in cell wall biosynthesis
MKMIFICGSLEPGRDGVGDYTRRFSGELVQQGHRVSIIAINDRFILKPIQSAQTENNHHIETLRIPSSWSSNKRFSYAKRFIDEYDPEWLSLQYVPYSYHTKGIPINLPYQLQTIGYNRKWHIMFHELWISKNGRLLNFFYSYLQKFIIKNIIRFTQPCLIHTHLPLFQEMLKDLSSDTLGLPLFSNIQPNKLDKQVKSDDQFIVGFFSQISYDKAIVDFLQSLHNKLIKENKQLKIILIGGEKNKMIKFSNLYKGLFDVEHTGFLEFNEISETIGKCAMGVTPVPRHALGKSGSVAAFLAHGVPVAAPVVDSSISSKYIGFYSDKLRASIIDEFNFEKYANAIVSAKFASKEIKLTNIAQKFIYDLNCCQTNNYIFNV